MQYRGGWGAGVLKEFFVTPGNRFQYRLRQDARAGATDTTVVGKLPAGALTGLVKKVAEAPKGPGADDAGSVSFVWMDKSGGKETKAYSMPTARSASGRRNYLKTLFRL